MKKLLSCSYFIIIGCWSNGNLKLSSYVKALKVNQLCFRGLWGHDANFNLTFDITNPAQSKNLSFRPCFIEFFYSIRQYKKFLQAVSDYLLGMGKDKSWYVSTVFDIYERLLKLTAFVDCYFYETNCIRVQWSQRLKQLYLWLDFH